LASKPSPSKSHSVVLATQNPIEQEGTYPLPEAQLDRFTFKLRVGYPSREEEKLILERLGGQKTPEAKQVLTAAAILEMRPHLDRMYVDDRVKEYILRLVVATRSDGEISSTEADAKALKEIRGAIRIGASPRATLFLNHASKANALRRSQLRYSRRYQGDCSRSPAPSLDSDFRSRSRSITVDEVIRRLLDTVVVPSAHENDFTTPAPCCGNFKTPHAPPCNGSTFG
jgi:MoxR-like ATPase